MNTVFPRRFGSLTAREKKKSSSPKEVSSNGWWLYRKEGKLAGNRRFCSEARGFCCVSLPLRQPVLFALEPPTDTLVLLAHQLPTPILLYSHTGIIINTQCRVICRTERMYFYCVFLKRKRRVLSRYVHILILHASSMWDLLCFHGEAK